MPQYPLCPNCLNSVQREEDHWYCPYCKRTWYDLDLVWR